ncbi:MAG: helicase-related protein [Thermofilum sp.]
MHTYGPSLGTNTPSAESRFAEKVIEYLRSRFHTEAPHISVLSPDHSLIPRLKSYKASPSIEEEGVEEDEGDLEAVEELLDPMKMRGQSTHGFEAVFKNFSDSSIVRMRTSFYIRKAPPVEFKKVTITSEIIGMKRIRISLEIEDPESSRKYPRSKDLQVGKLPFTAIVAIGLRSVVEEASKIVSEELYKKSDEVLLFTDDELLEALATSEYAGKGEKKIFCFLPRPESGEKRDASSRDYYVVQNLLYEIELSRRGDNEAQVLIVLRYIGPSLVERSDRRFVRVQGRFGYPRYAYVNDKRDRWSVQHLFEVESRLEWENVELPLSWQVSDEGVVYPGIRNIMPIGGLVAYDDSCRPEENCLILRDWHLTQEEIHPVEESERTVESSFKGVLQELVRNGRERGLSIDERALEEAMSIVLAGFKDAFPNVKRLYKFQEEALLEGLKHLLAGNHKTLVLQARTAGGKTLAFLLPILVFTAYLKLTAGWTGAYGTKALLIYPTIALQNDQSNTVFKVLWHMNKELLKKEQGEDLVISLGVLHGHTPKRQIVGERGVEEQELRLRCPVCDSRLLVTWYEEEVTKKVKIYREEVVCSNSSCQLNKQGHHRRLLELMIRASRDAIYSKPPDLLITNPDILNTRLTLGGREDPASLAIIGKQVYLCEKCGRVHDSSGIRKCERCKSESLRSVKFSHPRVIVIDEAHLMRGAFGAQSSHVFTVLEETIRRLNALPREWRPVYFISSATLNNPESRACELVATEKSNVVVTSASSKKRGEPTLRIHAFIMPKLYSPEATTGRIIEAIYSKQVSALFSNEKAKFNEELDELRRKAFPSRPATLVFVNRISEANELLNFAREYAPDARSDGHTTDYSGDRVRVEDMFSRGELDIIVATSGLEVGVDFDRVNIGIIYGSPFYTSDYTQRIGRAGRKQHCIIFNVFMPDKPIDHFYYRNWKVLSDSELREAMIRAEVYRIDRVNPFVVRRAVKRSLVAFVSMHPGFDDISNGPPSSLSGILNNLDTNLSDYIRMSLRVEKTELSRAVEEAQRTLEELKNSIRDQGGTARDMIERSIPGEQLRSLRTLEAQVEYEFEMETERRKRELSYAFRRCLPGQIISYRGIFYVVELYRNQIIYTSRLSS